MRLSVVVVERCQCIVQLNIFHFVSMKCLWNTKHVYAFSVTLLHSLVRSLAVFRFNLIDKRLNRSTIYYYMATLDISYTDEERMRENRENTARTHMHTRGAPTQTHIHTHEHTQKSPVNEKNERRRRRRSINYNEEKKTFLRFQCFGSIVREWLQPTDRKRCANKRNSCQTNCHTRAPAVWRITK